MRTVLIVNGEDFWPAYFPGCDVRRVRLQTAHWAWHEQVLRVFDGAQALRPDGVLWRLGAVRPRPSHRAAIEILRLSSVPCVNSAQVLGRGYDRLAMLAELREAGLPVIPFSVALGEGALEPLRPAFPAVLKAGNLHGGRGKARVETSAQWREAADLIYGLDDYATAEPFIDYARDVRCLAIGDQVWAMERRAPTWKVNAVEATATLIEPPQVLAEHTRRAMAHLNADVLGLDFLEARGGGYLLLESNDIPGLSGFPNACHEAVAEILARKMAGAS